MAVAWWTGEGCDPRVQVAFSTDAGRSFGAPVRVSRARAEGQTGVAFVQGGALVIWLEGDAVQARRIADDGTAGATVTLGPYGGRHRLAAPIRTGTGELLAAWLGPDGRLTSRLLTVGRPTRDALAMRSSE